ncbi:hypothetical protein [Nocardioides baculatus]|uniref:DUF4190 domain-containing protein n=1 Tax=Nocardioides baculatus TaxID=2801337 RepID=A0ABS1L7Q9_9ACTN|nr:hypothetical protein [Nocardioides baculatus]MBL0747723.1 hypothetical protein [Nocardioides baculatus]
MDETQPGVAPAPTTPAVAPPDTTPAHHAIVALLWLLLPVIGLPGSVIAACTALLARRGRTRLSTAMATCALVLCVAEAVLLWSLVS